MSRVAVIAYNLGGPDSPAAVRPFLQNLFSDPMILRVPAPVRFFLARFIAWRRAPVAQEIYARIGGRSPILPETEKQAAALQAALNDAEAAGAAAAAATDGAEYRVFVAMRYWHPFAGAVAREVAAWAPDRIVLLPLYPQFSTTTTGSFSRVWKTAAADAGLGVPVAEICCWPEADGFVDTVARETAAAIGTLPAGAPYRVLFSAHGLPKKIVDAGDPYADQVERTAAAVRARLPALGIAGDPDTRVSYQSRVGPLEWLRPYTEDEIKSAGAAGLSLVVVPVAFVSEHSETLVELDIEYAELAAEAGVLAYVRAPTVNADPAFIETLAALVRAAPESGVAPGLARGGSACGTGFADCPCRP